MSFADLGQWDLRFLKQRIPERRMRGSGDANGPQWLQAAPREIISVNHVDVLVPTVRQDAACLTLFGKPPLSMKRLMRFSVCSN
jgi:hypothetical protein